MMWDVQFEVLFGEEVYVFFCLEGEFLCCWSDELLLFQYELYGFVQCEGECDEVFDQQGVFLVQCEQIGDGDWLFGEQFDYDGDYDLLLMVWGKCEWFGEYECFEEQEWRLEYGEWECCLYVECDVELCGLYCLLDD